MIYTAPIEFTSIDEIINNFDYYKKMFTDNGVLLLRNARLSADDHKLFHGELKKKFECVEDDNKYVENHSSNKRRPTAGPDEIFLDWHVEHPYYRVPIVFGTWNMYNFKTDPENGKTYFVDMELLYKRLTTDEQEFLKKCKEENSHHGDTNNIKNEHGVIGYHWINDNPVIRTAWLIDTTMDVKLKTFDNRTPTPQEEGKYYDILTKIKNEVSYNEEIRIVHKWKEGDLLIVDIYKMCHAVTGGFDPADREFAGMWALKEHNKNN